MWCRSGRGTVWVGEVEGDGIAYGIAARWKDWEKRPRDSIEGRRGIGETAREGARPARDANWLKGESANAGPLMDKRGEHVVSMGPFLNIDD